MTRFTYTAITDLACLVGAVLAIGAAINIGVFVIERLP